MLTRSRIIRGVISLDDAMNMIPPGLMETKAEAGDYERDGLLYCGKCHTPKQTRQRGRLLPIVCRCAEQAQAMEEQAEARERFEKRLQALDTNHVTLPGALRHTFAEDDGKDLKVSQLCRRYVEQWDGMKAENIGLLFYGSVGTGKSFYASCIVNGLRERQVTATVTSFSRLLNLLQDNRERQEFIDGLNAYKLLVLDDLNAERETSYAAEQMLNIVETRSNAGLPIIVTTNLTLEQLQKPSSMQYARIFDRVLELCPVRVKLAGESRRQANAAAKEQIARELLT